MRNGKGLKHMDQVHMDSGYMGIGSKIHFVKLPSAFAKNHEPWVEKETMT
jgi:hypothetical protein